MAIIKMQSCYADKMILASVGKARTSFKTFSTADIYFYPP
jgi:hypothetical protein